MEQVQGIFTRLRPIDLDTNFFDAGLTSRSLADILGGLQDLGLTVRLVDLYRFPTVRTLVFELARRSDPGGGDTPGGLPWA